MHSSYLLAVLPAVVLGAPSISLAPLHVAKDAETVIPGKYIVKFKSDSALANHDNTHMAVASVVPGESNPDHVYSQVMSGFAGTLTDQAVDELRRHPDVDFVEKDSLVQLNSFVTQSDAVWGLARISHRSPDGTGYTYDSSAGQGTCVYIVDTGVDQTHPDFGNRAKQIKSFVAGQNTDGHGHGTHCAGTIGSKTYGVAKQADLYGVKVLNNEGQGSNSAIIAGMDYVASDSRSRSCPKGVLASMSLGGIYSPSTNNAATRLVSQHGVFLAVAAGNSNMDASFTSPASARDACTVAASDAKDARASFSNYGGVVDVFAPGVNIKSLAPGGGTAIMSGTSMATPHIAGLAAYLAGLGSGSGGQLCNKIQSLATRDALDNVPFGTVNMLAFNGNSG